MIDERTFVQNQYEKIHDLDCEKYPLNFYFYSNGIQFLCIKKGTQKYYVCGISTPFAPLFRQSNFDIYAVCDDLQSAVKQFERFLALLLFPLKMEGKLQECLF